MPNLMISFFGLKIQMKKKSKKTIINIKPINYDINYEYLCPRCGLNHWLTYVESQTNKFKIACDCGVILIPAQITNIKLKYKKYKQKNKPLHKSENKTLPEIVKDDITLSEHTLQIVSDALLEYGFEKSEAVTMVQKSFNELKTDNTVELLKHALKSLGVTNASFVETN